MRRATPVLQTLVTLAAVIVLAGCKGNGANGGMSSVDIQAATVQTGDVHYIQILVHELATGALVYDSGLQPTSNFQDTRQMLEEQVLLAGATDFTFDAAAFGTSDPSSFLAQGNTVQEATQPAGHSTQILIVIDLNAGSTNPTSSTDITAITDNIPILGQPKLSGTIAVGQTLTINNTATDEDQDVDAGPIDHTETLTFFTTILAGNITPAVPDLFAMGQSYQFTIAGDQPIQLLQGVVDRLDQATWEIIQIDPKTGAFGVIDRGEGFGIFEDVDPTPGGRPLDTFGTHPIAVFVAKRDHAPVPQVLSITRDVNDATQVGPDNLAVWIGGTVQSFNVYQLPPGSNPVKVYKLRVAVTAPDGSTTIDTMRFTPDGANHFPYGLEAQEENQLFNPSISTVLPPDNHFPGDQLDFDGANFTHVGFVYFTSAGGQIYFADTFADDSDSHFHVDIPARAPPGSYVITVYTYDRLHTDTSINPINLSSTDQDPPLVTSLSANGVDGDALISFTLSDDSGIMEVHCVLDGGQDTICGDSESGSYTLHELSPGPHDIQVYGIDTVGNSGAGATPGPAPTQRADLAFEEMLETGRAILIGQSDVGANGDGSLTPMQQIFLQGVRASGASGFGRGVRVVEFLPSVDLDNAACDDALAALASSFGGGGSCSDTSTDPWFSQFSDPGSLATALLGNDVLVVPALGDPDLAASLGQEWRPALQSFLDDGGVVVLFDNADDGNYQIYTYTAPDGSQLIGLALDGTPGASTAQVFQSDDPLAGSDGSVDFAANPVATPSGYTSADDTAVFTASDVYAIPVYVTATDPPACNSTGGSPPRTGCSPDAEVIEKPFPAPVAAHSAGSDVADGNSVVAYTHTSLAGTVLLDMVHADPNGNTVLNMRSGGQVTVDAYDLSPPAFTFFLGVTPLDALATGPNAPNPSGNDVFQSYQLQYANADWPANVNDLRSNNGFGPYRDGGHGNDDAPGGTENPSTLADANGQSNLLVTAEDTSFNPIGYVAVSGINANDTVTLGWGDFTAPVTFPVQVNHPMATPSITPPAGITPTALAETTSMSVDLQTGHDGFDYSDGVPRALTMASTFSTANGSSSNPYPSPLPSWPHYIPQVPAGWAESSLIAFQVNMAQGANASVTNPDGSTTNYSENVNNNGFRRNRVALLPSTSLTLDTDQLIPFIASVHADASTPNQMLFTIGSAVPLFGDGASILMQITLSDPSSTTTQNYSFTFVFPTGATFQIPQLPDVLAAQMPLDPSRFPTVQLRMRGYIRQSSALGSYAAFKKQYPTAFGSAGYLDPTPPAAGKENYDEVRIFQYNYILSTTGP